MQHFLQDYGEALLLSVIGLSLIGFLHELLSLLSF